MPAVRISRETVVKDQRGAAYSRDVIAAATPIGDDILQIELRTFEGIIEAHPLAIGLGDVVEKLAKPIAKALNLPCLDASGNLKPDSGCAKRRDLLNKITISVP